MGRKKRVKSLSLKTTKSDEVNGVDENDEEKVDDRKADLSLASSSSHENLEKYFDERRRYSTSSQEDEDDYYDTNNLLPMDIQQMILGDGDVSKVTINQEYPEEESEVEKVKKSESATPLSPSEIYDDIFETFQVKKSPNVKCYSPRKLNAEAAPVKQTEEMMKDLKITPPVQESGSESFKILKTVLMEMVSEAKPVQEEVKSETMELDVPPVIEQDLPKEETKEVIKTPKKQTKKTEKKVKETKKTEPKKVKKEPKEPKKPKETKKKEPKTPKAKDVEKMSKKAIKDALKMAENRKKLPPKERFKFPERKLFAKENLVNGEEKTEEKTEAKPEVRRRSNRIRANRWEDLSEVVLPPPSLPPPPVPSLPTPVSTSTPPPLPYFDSDKPVKVKSRWRRTSELEMGAGLTSDSDASVSSISALSVKSESQNSPMEIMAPPKLPLVTVHPEIEERLKSFESITANIFLLPRRKNKELNDMQCDCELTKEIVKGEKKGCGVDCLNRMLQIECGPSCSLGNLCTNKLIQNCQNTKLEVVKTMKKGLGLVASANTESGSFLMEYVGEVIDPKEFKKRAKEYSKEKSRHFYFMALDSDSVIDATQKGNISRFINHSCDPNSETQQWLVNGKRRIGFFSVKPIAKGEEITFDYKFQRYGKEAQRCYCESSNCRGWIGEEPDDEEDEEEEEEDEEEEEEEEEEEKPENEDAKVKEIEEDKPPDQVITEIKTEKPEKEKEKKEKKKKEKRKDIVEFITEPDLNEEISKLSSSGMKNQAQTLKMSRLMLRAENVESKCRLLDIVLAAERACLRLFLDYRGLTLLYSWMSGSKTSNNLKIKALKTLEILPITNKTILKDSKVIDVVKDWAYPGVHKEPTKEKAAEESKSPDSVETPKTESGNSQDSQSLDATMADEKVSMIVELSKALISKWADLKEEFRIPKKQRVEQMKEHEREANRGYVDPRDENKATYESRGGVGYRHWPNEKERKQEKDRRNRGRDSPESREQRYREKNGLIGGLKLTKVQRRELFELQVKEEEKQRKKQLEEVNEMWLNHKEKCAALGVDPAKTPLYYHNDGFPVLYQPQTGTWVPIPQDAVESDPVFRHRPGNPMIGPLMPHGFPPPATPPPGFVPQLGAPPYREIMPPGTPGAPFREMMPGTPNIGVPPPFREIVPPGTPNHVAPYRDILPPGTPTQINIPTVMGRPPGVNVPPSPYHQVPPQFNQPPPPLPIASIPYQATPNPVYPYVQQSPLENMTPSKTPVVMNQTSVQPQPTLPPPPRKLPPGWKKAKDKEGRFYFYHGKIRKSQWNFPTEQEIAAAIAWTSQITANDESESDDDDSDSDDDDDSSSEEEEEKDSSPPFKEEEEDEEEQDASEKRKVEEELPILPGLEPEISPINNQENNEPVLKKRREGLVQVNIISPRDEEENYRKGIKKSKIRETKEKLARAKQRHKKEKMKKAKRCEADTSSDRRIKEQFRVEMAKFVIVHLNPYRKPDCDVGRIENTSDFKHLARKLTHFVMVKELRHLPSVEGLVCNDNVKHKAKDFIKKYMAKFGPVYTRGPEDAMN